MSQTTTIKAGESGKTITLQEGKALVLTGAAGAAGVAYLLDPALGGTNSSRSWVIAAGSLAPIGPYEGTQRVLVTCAAGSIAAVTKEAVLTISGTPTAPGQPAKPVLTAMAGAVSLAWTPGADGSTPTTGNVWTDINGNVTVLTTNPQVITAPAGTPYTGTVKTQNAQGFGPPSVQADAVTPTAAPAITALSSATIFGDSLMANGNPVVSGSGPAQGGETSVSHVGWANDILRQSGVGIDVVFLRAVGGTTLQQQFANQLPLVLADATDGAWFHGGVNSYNDSITTPLGGPYTQAQNISVATNIINQLSASKKWVIVDAIQPVSQSGTNGAKARASEFAAHNAAIKALCDSLPNVIYFDSYVVLIDSASAQLNPLPNLILGGDGIHYTTWGSRAVGTAAAATVGPRLNLTKYKTAGANLLPDFSTTGGTTTPGSGTITGGAALANNWNCAITSGSAAVTLSNPVAGKLRLSISNPGGSASSIVLSALNTAALLAAIGNGDTIQCGFDFATIGTSTNLTRISCAFRTNGSTGTLWNAMTRDLANESASDFKYDQSASSGRRWGHPRTVPAAPTAVDFLITISVDAGGSAVVDISLPTLFRLT